MYTWLQDHMIMTTEHLQLIQTSFENFSYGYVHMVAGQQKHDDGALQLFWIPLDKLALAMYILVTGPHE